MLYVVVYICSHQIYSLIEVYVWPFLIFPMRNQISNTREWFILSPSEVASLFLNHILFIGQDINSVQ